MLDETSVSPTSLSRRAKGKAQWLAERKTGIGGSDAAAVLGVSLYETPLSVYMDKLDLTPPKEVTEAMNWGNLLEEPIAREYRRITGSKYERTPKYTIQRHPKYPWMIASVDRKIYGESKLLEIKTGKSGPQWGLACTDQVPLQYILQCAHYMAVTGCQYCDLAVLLDGSDFRVYHLNRDLELEAMLINGEKMFWEGHVLPQIPPKATPQQYAEYLKTRYPEDRAPILRTQNMQPQDRDAADAAMLTLAQTKAAAEAAEELYIGAQNVVKGIIGEAGGLEAIGRRVTWRKSKDTTKVNWEAVVLDMLKVKSPEPWYPDQIKELVLLHTAVKQGARPFLGPKMIGGDTSNG